MSMIIKIGSLDKLDKHLESLLNKFNIILVQVKILIYSFN